MNKIEITNQQKQAFELIEKTNVSFFLTGKAGSGKTTFLKNVQKEVDKQFVILAPTGVAAILAGGETIHSFFGFPLEAMPIGSVGRISKDRFATIKRVDTIIIDEVSMVRCDIIDAIDATLRDCMRSTLPFGGKQMVFVGDLFQLEPVVKKDAELDVIKDNYDTSKPFFFKAKVFKQMNMPTIEFRKVYRQDDEEFLAILNNVRNGIATSDDLNRLNLRCGVAIPKDEMIITLTSTNPIARKINEGRLNAIDEEEFTYEAKIEKEFNKDKAPVDYLLRLKKGTQVMFCRNDSLRRWANGTLGVVSKIDAENIYVTVKNGNEYKVERTAWEAKKYKYDKENKRLEKEVVGTFSQYPLKMAWAITIHKSQGLTFDKVIIDLSRGVFSDGQLYVALSRVRSLDGLFLTYPIQTSYIRGSKEVIRFSKKYNDDDMIEREIRKGSDIYECMKNEDYDTAALHLLLMGVEYASKGNLKEAILCIGDMFKTMISDEHLIGSLKCLRDLPIQNADTVTANMLNAVFLLYAENYGESLTFVEKVLSSHQCKEALYIKARCMTNLGHLQEADRVNVSICDIIGKNPDMKVYYEVAMLNWRIGDPCMGIMQAIYNLRPSYTLALKNLRGMMKDKKNSLETNEDNKFVVLFNSDMSDKDFLRELSAGSNDEQTEFRKIVLNQAFK